jgi:hypothetical protein
MIEPRSRGVLETRFRGYDGFYRAVVIPGRERSERTRNL